MVLKITDFRIQCIGMRLQFSRFLRHSMLEKRIRRFFDLSVPRQLVGTAIRAGALARQTARRYLSTNCLEAHAETALNSSRKIIDPI